MIVPRKFPAISEDEMRRRLQPPTGKIRLIIDTDAYNEIDDQYAIAWALLSQDRFAIEGVLAEPYSQRHHKEPLRKAYNMLKADLNADLSEFMRKYRRAALNMLESGINANEIEFVDPDEGMELSYQEIVKVYNLLGENSDGKAFRGSPGYLQSYDAPLDTPAARHLIERAMANEDGMLYVAAIGCVTNIASAILMEPEIVNRMVVLWTSSYPSNMPFSNEPSLNLVQDKLSSQLLFNCGVPHVYLPGYYIGEQLKLSLPDMETWVRGKGKIGDYLYHLYTHNPIHTIQGIGHGDHFGRTWIIWDLINFAWLLNPEWVPTREVRSPILNDDLYWEQDSTRHLMLEAYGIDRDAIFRDFFTKLQKAP